MQRLQRDIPTISTFHCQAGDHHFTISVAMVPERAIPLGVRLRHPDEVDTLGGEGLTPWVLLAYKTLTAHPELWYKNRPGDRQLARLDHTGR